MARRSEDFAHLGSHGGYTQALTVGKGFSGSGRDTAKRGAAMGHGLGQGGRGTETAYARHLALIRNYHRCDVCDLILQYEYVLVPVCFVGCSWCLLVLVSLR